MKKRILSLLMVGAMTAGMLAGCGSKTDAPADNTAKEETPATEEAKEETPATEEKEAVEPVTLNVAYMPNYGSSGLLRRRRNHSKSCRVPGWSDNHFRYGVRKY